MAEVAEAQPLSLEPGFVEDVDAFMAGKADVDTAIGELNQRYQFLRVKENQVLSKRQRLQQKEADLKKTLGCVTMLLEAKASEEDTIVDYSLSANMFASAKIADASHVNLWLGADVMLEYPVEEAQSVLSSNLERCQESLKENQTEWNTIRDCVTTTEVNIARVYNWDVEKRRKDKAIAA